MSISPSAIYDFAYLIVQSCLPTFIWCCSAPSSFDSPAFSAPSGLYFLAALLVGEGLLEMIESIGPAQVVGSYALDLMTSPDIDFSLQLPHELDIPTFFELGRRIACKFQVTRMQFENVFLRPWGSRDHGLYWGVQLIHSERTWKLDIWGHGEEAYAARKPPAKPPTDSMPPAFAC